jgi:hypothetical protein
LHFQTQILEVFNDLVTVPHPHVGGAGRGDAAIGDRAHDKQHGNGGSERGLHRPIRHGLRLHLAPGGKGAAIPLMTLKAVRGQPVAKEVFAGGISIVMLAYGEVKPRLTAVSHRPSAEIHC